MEHVITTAPSAVATLDTPASELRATRGDTQRQRPGLISLISAVGLGLGLLAAGAAHADAPLLDTPDASEAPIEISEAPIEAATLAAACEAGDAVACNDLGVSYEHGYSVPRDSVAAAQLFERACNGGVTDGCNNLGAGLERREATRARASELYRRACEAGSALGCSNLGALYARSARTPADVRSARQLFERACAGGSATGCENLQATLAR